MKTLTDGWPGGWNTRWHRLVPINVRRPTILARFSEMSYFYAHLSNTFPLHSCNHTLCRLFPSIASRSSLLILVWRVGQPYARRRS